ncbi:flagellar biosynthetic protein FliQ [Collimonas sp. OK412]|jgi:flagellar biosynthetic protein FliQ
MTTDDKNTRDKIKSFARGACKALFFGIRVPKVSMHADLALQMMADMFWTGLLVCMPVLALSMLVGLIVSILQVVTQVQEMSLTFVPKLLAAGVALMVFGPWMLHKLAQFSTKLWSDIPSMF